MHLPFSPGLNTVSINVGASSARVKVTDGRGAIQVRVMNNGTATAWVRFGDSNVNADTASGIPVAAGAAEVFTVNSPYNDPVYASAIAAAATGYIYFTPGEGI